MNIPVSKPIPVPLALVLVGLLAAAGCQSPTDSKPSKPSKVAVTGVVTTLAGSAGQNGSTDDTGTAARFYYPFAVTTDGTNVYIAEEGNHTIRKIVIATGVVTTLAGAAEQTGFEDGTGPAARFNYPSGVATDGTNLYVADSNNNMIRKIVIATGEVTTLAGSTTSGSTDGTGAAARFNYPYGVATDGTNVYVADTNNHTIRKIVIATREVTTIAGSTTSGSLDGTGTAARFCYPSGAATDGTNLYISDLNNNMIRKVVIATGVVTTLAGSTTPGTADGTGTAARFHNPYGVATDGANLYVADSYTHKIRKIVLATGEVTTVAGSNTSGSADGTGSAASFFTPSGVAVSATDPSVLLVADCENQLIRMIR